MLTYLTAGNKARKIYGLHKGFFPSSQQILTYVFIYKGFRSKLENKQCAVSIFYVILLADADLLCFLQSQNYSRADL